MTYLQVLAYIESGGELFRRLSPHEVALLQDDNAGVITPGKPALYLLS